MDFFSLRTFGWCTGRELSLAKSHVQAQKKPNNGNALTKEKRNRMLELNIDCVHCGTLLSGNNYNTEHILDVSLGGENTVDNKMLMCKICNSARAELKVSLLGNQPTMAKWDLVEAYVPPPPPPPPWSFITVDHGHAHGANIPQVHQEFLRLASGGRERERNGTRWFARASNTSLTVSSEGAELDLHVQHAKLVCPPGAVDGLVFLCVNGFEVRHRTGADINRMRLPRIPCPIRSPQAMKRRQPSIRNRNQATCPPPP